MSTEIVLLVVLGSCVGFFCFLCILMHCCRFQFTTYVITKVPGASWFQGDISLDAMQAEHHQCPKYEALPGEGQLVRFDYREDKSKNSSKTGRHLRVVTYNIFLGQNLRGVVAQMKRLEPPPDVILLQEDNMFTDEDETKGKHSYRLYEEKSKDDMFTDKDDTEGEHCYRHAGGFLAKELGMCGAFVPVYFRPDKIGGRVHGGCYGISVLSRRELFNVQALRCAPRPPLVDSIAENIGLVGWRHFVYAELEVSSPAGGPNSRVGVVSVHLPSAGLYRSKLAMCETLIRQINDLQKAERLPTIIGGDFNNLAFACRYLPMGAVDLACSTWCCRSEDKVFARALRRWAERPDLRDLTYSGIMCDREIGTYPMRLCGGACRYSFKMDYLLMDQGKFQVLNHEVQNGPVKPNVAVQGSDHLWVLSDVNVLSSVREIKK